MNEILKSKKNWDWKKTYLFEIKKKIEQIEEENTENAEVSTPVNAPKVTSIRVETFGIDYGMPNTLTPFDYTSWLYNQFGIGL